MPASWLPGLDGAVRQRFARARRRREHLSPSRRSRLRPRRGGWRRRRRWRRGRRTARRRSWGPSLKVARDAAGRVDGRRAGLREEERRAARVAAAGAAKDPAGRTTLDALRREDVPPGRDAARCCPAVLGGAAARPRVPEADELGRLARRRQGRVPVRAADPLDGRAARRRRSCPSRSSSSSTAREGRRDRRERRRRPTAIASCPAARRAAPLGVRVVRGPRRRRCGARSSCSTRAARERAHRGAAAPAIGGDAGRERPRPGSRSGATSSSTRPSSSGSDARGVPLAAARGAGDRARPPPEVRAPARAAGQVDALRGAHRTRRRPRNASCAAWGASWSPACATPRSSSPRTCKRPLADRVEDLPGVTFHHDLGHLPRQGRAPGAPRRRDGEGRLLPDEAEAAAAREAARLCQGRPRPRSWCASSRSCRA